MAVDEDPWLTWDVSGWQTYLVEPGGSQGAEWLVEPETGGRWLHKFTHIPGNGAEQGEDWSEALSTQVAHLLGIPVADVRLCARHGRRGSLSRDVTPDGFDLYEGGVVLEGSGLPDYVPHREGEAAVDPDRPGVKRPGHSLRNIKRALHGVETPPKFDDTSGLSAFDVFVGFLILDAVIANRDRHEQNWAVLVPRLTSRTPMLAPSYDHASSLGFNLTDAKRAHHLTAMEGFARRGTAHRFEHRGAPPTLVDNAVRALELCSAAGSHWWHNAISSLDLTQLEATLRAKRPRGMSELAATFAIELLRTNLRRLRNALERGA